MIIEISAFITAHAGDGIEKCQDSFSLNLQNKSFAISDGVSNSLYPQVWSKLLTESYSYQIWEIEDDLVIPFDKLVPKYESIVNEEYAKLNDDEKFCFELSREKCPLGAATLLGLRINERTVTMNTIGDSTLFVYNANENNLKFSSSMGVGDCIEYGNEPHCILSNRTLVGKILTKHFELSNGYIFLMTDALSEWFYNSNQNINENIEDLSNLRDHSDFQNFIDRLRREHKLHDDDMTLVVLKISEEEAPGLVFRGNHIDNIQSILLEEKEQELANCKDNLQRAVSDLEYEKTKVTRLKVENESLNNKLQSLKARYNDFVRKIKRLIDEETFS